jgi:hypothetical protein
MLRQLITQVPHAMLFLRKLETIDVLEQGNRLARFTRSLEADSVRINGPAGEETWLLSEADFTAEARTLRKRHPLIRDRHAQVRIALRPGETVDGRLYATLPTRIPTGLQLHLDSSFFPRFDRKGILLDAGYEGDWNRAAITAAALLIADTAEGLARALGPKQFWALVSDARTLHGRGTGESKPPLAELWPKLTETLPAATVMWTRSEEWARVDETVATGNDSALAGLLEDLGAPTVAPLIAALVPERALKIERIDLSRLLTQLEEQPLRDGATVEELPAALRSERRRTALRKELGRLVHASDGLDEEAKDTLRTLPIWQAHDGRFNSFQNSWLVPPDAVGPLAGFASYAFVAWPGKDAGSKALAEVGDRYSVEQALKDLASDPKADLEGLPAREAKGILAWFKARVGDLSDEQLEHLGDLPLVPTHQGLRAAAATVQTGRFNDPLQLTSVLDRKATKGLEPLIAKLGVRKLTFEDYLREHVAELDPEATVSIRALSELVRQCARRRDTIDGDPALARILETLAWIPCKDGQRRPPGEVYFNTLLVREVLGGSAPLVHPSIRPNTSPGDLLRLLGVSDAPRPDDIAARVEEITEDAPDEHRITQLITILRYLSEHGGDLQSIDFAPLRHADWLPAEGKGGWHAPNRVYLTFDRNLFASSARFIALRRVDQERLRTTLTALGCPTSPSAALVVEDVIHRAAEDEPPTPQQLRWLDSHASDQDVATLSEHAFLPTMEGRLERPERLFRDPHQLTPWRATLRRGFHAHVSLLEVLGVATGPGVDAAIDVLLEIAASSRTREPLTDETLAVVNSCWDLLTSAGVTDLARLGSDPVVPAADRRLRSTSAMLLEDVPDVDRWLSSRAQQHLVALDGRQHAFEAAGVGRLSQQRRGEVLARTEAIEGHWIEDRVHERRLQLARIVAGEAGDWHGVVELTRAVAVIAIGALTVRYRLENLPTLPQNPEVEEGAFHDRDRDELLVCVTDGRPDWPAFAHVVRDEILPGSTPGASLAIGIALSADSLTDADERLGDYPPLRDEVRAAFERAASDKPDATPAYEPDESYDEEYDHDGDGGDHEDAGEHDIGADTGLGGDADAAHDEDEAEHEEDEAGLGGEHAHDIEGAHGGGEGEGGRARGGTAGADGRGATDRRGATTDGKGRKGRGSSGKGGASSADYQLISYVSTHDGATDSPDGASGEQEHRDAAGEAGVDLVIAHLEDELRGTGSQIEKMPDKNKGYDILVRDEHGVPTRYIEVKSTEGRWGLRGVGLSDAQFIHAQKERVKYWLYVVEFLYESDAQVWWIRDPATRVRYFHYDHGWQAATEGKAWVKGAREV